MYMSSTLIWPLKQIKKMSQRSIAIHNTINFRETKNVLVLWIQCFGLTIVSLFWHSILPQIEYYLMVEYYLLVPVNTNIESKVFSNEFDPSLKLVH